MQMLGMRSRGGEKEEGSPEVNDAGNRLEIKGFDSFGSNDMFFRADKIDLKSLDIQLEKQINKAWSKGKVDSKRPKEGWEIDLSKLPRNIWNCVSRNLRWSGCCRGKKQGENPYLNTDAGTMPPFEHSESLS